MNPEHFGKWLLSLGFKGWFLYMFRAIEQTAFVVEPIHADLFDSFEKILGNTYKRLNINIPPRSAKTTLAIYFIIYTWLLNPKANFIYTSFSQSLLNDIAVRMRNILESPIYKSMYANFVNFESEEANPIDDFWLEYLKKETGKNTYSTKKITTAHGGICLFSSIGSQITGYGAGIRNGKGFTGALIIDDANKPADVHSAVMRNKVERYFEETLLSRLNSSDVPIINIQQRLHLGDLSGILETKYGFETLKKPLLDENGVCQLPQQYSPERIKELQINNYMFVSQYQQEPIVLGGAIIKREWFGYYDSEKDYEYKRIVIAGDTAMTAKESSDYSCLLVGGVTKNNRLHILQMLHQKLEYPELKQAAIGLFNSYQTGATKASAIYLENKASGVQLIQDFKKSGLPVTGIDVTKDKLTRVEEVLEYIANGLILLPNSETYGNNPVFLAECEAFTRDLAQTHDDIVDTLVHLINSTIANRKVSILEVL